MGVNIIKILILGAGAIGGYFGGRLIEAGSDVTFLVRQKRAEQLKEHGLIVKSPLGDIHCPVNTVLRENLKRVYDCVLLSCKAYDLQDAIDAVGPAVGPQTIVVPLLNGLAHLETLDRAFGATRVLGGLCNIPVTVDAEGNVQHMSNGHRIAFGPRFGEPDARTLALLRMFKSTPVEVLNSTNIMQDMWEKFVLLTTLAGMTCLMRASIGDIMETTHGEALTLELLDNCVKIATGEGYPQNETRLEETRKTLTSRNSILTSSMLRDIERGGRVEADHIFGDMRRRAHRTGIPTPLLDLIITHLHSYAARRQRESAVPQ
ncbi:MAG: 2-dehydropantoate 2-reductase [Candidatus Nitrotoga sp.]